MPTVSTNHPPPTSKDVFQDMCVELYQSTHRDDIVEIYGRNGQSQFGIDVIVRNEFRDRIICLQCKCREEVTEKILSDDLAKTKDAPFRIWRFVFLVAVKRDRKLQDAIIKLQDEYPFLIEIRFWPDIAGAIAGNADLAKRYFEYTVTKLIEVEKSPSAVHLALTVEYSWYSLVVVRMSAFERYEGQDDLVLLTGLQADKKAGFTRLGGGHWTDVLKSAVPFRVDAYAVWKWLSQFETFEELLHFSGEQAIEGLTPAELAEVGRH